MNGWLKYGLCIGLGMVIGAAAATFVSRNPNAVRKGMANAMGKTMDLKDKVHSAFETAKENFEDLAAEARASRDKNEA